MLSQTLLFSAALAPAQSTNYSCTRQTAECCLGIGMQAEMVAPFSAAKIPWLLKKRLGSHMR